MSIQSEISRINSAKATLAQNLTTMGVESSSSDSIETLANNVLNIEGGGSLPDMTSATNGQVLTVTTNSETSEKEAVWEDSHLNEFILDDKYNFYYSHFHNNLTISGKNNLIFPTSTSISSQPTANISGDSNFIFGHLYSSQYHPVKIFSNSSSLIFAHQNFSYDMYVGTTNTTASIIFGSIESSGVITRLFLGSNDDSTTITSSLIFGVLRFPSNSNSVIGANCYSTIKACLIFGYGNGEAITGGGSASGSLVFGCTTGNSRVISNGIYCTSSGSLVGGYGNLINSSGNGSLVFGYYSVRSTGVGTAVLNSHNTANADYTHVIGYGNLANGMYSHVQGKYNVPNTLLFADIVGNGTASDSLSNAEATDWSGNKYLSGDVYINCTDYTEDSNGALNTTNCGGTKLIPIPEFDPTGKDTSKTYTLGMVYNETTTTWEMQWV